MIQIQRYATPFIQTLFPTSGSLPTNVANPYAFPPAADSFGWNGTAKVPITISGGDIQALALLASYVFLGRPERYIFTNNVQLYLFNQTQMNSDETVSAGKSSHKSSLSYNHIVRMLSFGAIPITHLQQNRFLSWDDGNAGESPLSSSALFLNNHDRFSHHTFSFYRDVMTSEWVKKSPTLNFATMQFGVDPFNINPTGGVNMSMTDRIEQLYNLNVNAPDMTNGAFVFNRAYSANVLVACRGLCGVKFSS